MSGTHEVSPLRRTLRLLRPHLRQHLPLIAGGLLALSADVVLRVLEPWPVKFAIDAVSVALGAHLADATGLSADPATTLVTAALAIGIIIAGRALANYGATVAFALTGARVATELRSRVFAHVQDLPLRYHGRASIGDTSQRLVGDVGRLQEVAVTAGLPLVGNVATVTLLLAVMVILDPILSLIVLATAGLYLLISRLATPRITQASRSTRRGEGQLVGSAAEALAAIRVVQAYNLENTVAKDFADGNARAMKAGIRARRLAARLERSTDVLVGLAQAVVLAFGGYQVLNGRMTPGDLVLFLMYLKIAMKPLRDMAKYTGRIARAAASGERIADLMDETNELPDPARPVPMGQIEGSVDVVNVHARDGRGEPLFRGLDLHIRPGEKVGLLGPSGSGKTTLTSYLLRLADPDHGTIRVGGHDTTTVRRSDLRAHVAVVLQESVLFATTVRENIRFGLPDVSDAEIERACRRAGAHDFVTALPDGYDTVLGQRGDTLSGGQRQRLAIARALVRDAEVVILDEPTAGLDPVSKRQVLDSLGELTAQRTAIVIAHDLETLGGVDRIVWLEDGRIREDGSPAALAADPRSTYARWLARQRRASA